MAKERMRTVWRKSDGLYYVQVVRGGTWVDINPRGMCPHQYQEFRKLTGLAAKAN